MTTLTDLLAIGLTVFMHQSQAYPFNSIDFPSVFEQAQFEDGGKVSASDVNANLMALEKRFNESLFANKSKVGGSGLGVSTENRMTELQEQFEGVQSLKQDEKQTKQQMEKMQNRLETMEKKISSASAVEATLDDLEAKVSTGSKETKKDIEDLKTTQDNTDEKLATIDVKVTDVKDKIQETEKKVILIKEDVEKLKHRFDAQGTQPGQSSLGSSNGGRPEHSGQSSLGSSNGGRPEHSGQSSLGSSNGGRPEQSGNRPGANSPGSGRPGSVDPGSEKPGAVDPAKLCPSDYHYDASAVICVKLVRSSLSGSSANQKCAQLADRGSLAILDNNDKVRAVQNYLRREGQRTDVFVGGTKEPGYSTREYRWLMTDEPIDLQAPWCPGQPENRDCVSLWAGRGFCLDDSWCDNATSFLCQVDLSAEQKKKEEEEAGFDEFD